MSLFPVPVSGQPIPRGWFARLVRFMNSLVLHGDGSYTQVKHTDGGTFVTLTPAMVDALNKASRGPSGPAATQHLTVDVTGGTATVGLSGSTSSAQFVSTGSITISSNTSGQIEIDCTGGTSEAVFFPDFTDTPIAVSAETYYPLNVNMWLIGHAGIYSGSGAVFPTRVSLKIYNLAGTTLVRDLTLYENSGVFSASSNNGEDVPVCIPIKAGNNIRITTTGSGSFSLNLYHI